MALANSNIPEDVRAVAADGTQLRYKLMELSALYPDAIALGRGDPDLATPAHIIDAAKAAMRDGKMGATPIAGLPELRDAIAAKLRTENGLTVERENVIVTTGGQEGLYLVMQTLLDPGDEVLVPDPRYTSYDEAIASAGGKMVLVPTTHEDAFNLRPEAIEAAITPKTKVILIITPSNPTSGIVTADRLRAIAEIAIRHNLIVISDEIYDRLVYGIPHVCFPALPGARPRTLLLGGFSKDYAMTGWRIGFAAGPASIIQGLVRIHQYTIMSAPTTAQVAAIDALKNCDEDVIEMREEYDRRRKLIVSGLNRIGLPTFEPRGAFYAFPKVSVTGLDDETFCNRLLNEEHVAIVPGSSFGAGGEGFARCSYATAYEKIEEALRRIEKFVNRL